MKIINLFARNLHNGKVDLLFMQIINLFARNLLNYKVSLFFMQDKNLFAELGMAAPNVLPQVVDGGKVLGALFATVATMSRGCSHCQGLVRTEYCKVKVK